MPDIGLLRIACRVIARAPSARPIDRPNSSASAKDQPLRTTLESQRLRKPVVCRVGCRGITSVAVLLSGGCIPMQHDRDKRPGITPGLVPHP